MGQRRVHGDADWRDRGGHQPRDAMMASKPPAASRWESLRAPAPRASQGGQLRDTLVLNVWPAEPGGNTSLCFETCVWSLLSQGARAPGGSEQTQVQSSGEATRSATPTRCIVQEEPPKRHLRLRLARSPPAGVPPAGPPADGASTAGQGPTSSCAGRSIDSGSASKHSIPSTSRGSGALWLSRSAW